MKEKKIVVPEHGAEIVEKLVITWFDTFTQRFEKLIKGLAEQKVGTHIDRRLSDLVMLFEEDTKIAVRRCVKRIKGKSPKEACEDMINSINAEWEEFSNDCKGSGFLVNNGDDGESSMSLHLRKAVKQLKNSAEDLVAGWAK